MKILKVIHPVVSVMIILTLALPLPAMAQGEGGGGQAGTFSREQLAQMLAPIALFPDSLLSQVLMASTYPLEVVEADRWVKKNAGLKDNALDEALVEKEWDPSVKSLCHFPSILSAMSDKIAHTTKLGDAFLAQQGEVMAMVQELRAKALDAGNLKSTGEQNVVEERDAIMIEPANPEVVYVPSYDPVYVYGPWWYPAYPPYYWWTGAVIWGPGISFWPGIFVGAFIGSWSYFDWYNHYIFIDWHKTRHFHRHHRDRDGRDRWHHDADHRRGVAYRDRDTARKFGQAPERSRESRRELRGFPEHGTMDRQTRERIQRDLERTPMKSGETVRPERSRTREQIERREQRVIPQRENVFDGSDSRRQRMESERGRSSRENINRGSREGTGRDQGISRGQGNGRGQGSGGVQSGGRSQGSGGVQSGGRSQGSGGVQSGGRSQGSGGGQGGGKSQGRGGGQGGRSQGSGGDSRRIVK